MTVQMLPIKDGLIITDTKVNRAEHVWFECEIDGHVWYKCCLCGGVARVPGGDVLVYHPLTEEERSWCPPKKGTNAGSSSKG